jgi:transcriptional regulator with XRE-family HTH domain
MNLHNLMEKAGVKRKDLAELMDTTVVTIYRWEKGIHEPDHDALRKLAQILNCSVDELLNPPSPPPGEIVPEPGAERRTA